jgi:deoxyribodipyrimidine photo-lyase
VDTALVWLRRDLRLNDNLALHNAVTGGYQVAVLFVIDDSILSGSRVSAARVALMCDTLAHLDSSLRDYGSRLLVRRGIPDVVVPDVARAISAAAVFANFDYTPYARRRDAAVADALKEIPLILSHDRMMVPPDEIATGTGTPYTVFTPYSKKWHALPKLYPEPVEIELRGMFRDLSGIESLPCPTPDSLGMSSPVPLPDASPSAAQKRLRDFTVQRIFKYKDTRNMLADFRDADVGTSSLSPYIRWGLLSPREIYRAVENASAEASNDEECGSVQAWLNEIVWSEFYTSILWHFPQVVTRNFNARYDHLGWRHDPDDFAAWAEGRTGYPVVDAAMRQLVATGWMHNRARMITASFLTRDLLIDWREGERFFMRHLIDGDLAANNGGWQWAAGTGTDAQPYFRIFNPVSQSMRFDPQGNYIRRWVPELAALPGPFVHAPWKAPSPPKDYPPPIVDHAFARLRALDAFKRIR